MNGFHEESGPDRSRQVPIYWYLPVPTEIGNECFRTIYMYSNSITNYMEAQLESFFQL